MLGQFSRTTPQLRPSLRSNPVFDVAHASEKKDDVEADPVSGNNITISGTKMLIVKQMTQIRKNKQRLIILKQKCMIFSN